MGEVGRAYLVRAAGTKDLGTLADAVDKELQHIADRAETGQISIRTTLPHDNEGKPGEQVLLDDNTGLLGTRGAKYKLYKFSDGWYQESALRKLR